MRNQRISRAGGIFVLGINDRGCLCMSREVEEERWLPQKAVLLLLEDIDDYFSERDGYVGTKTQERVSLKRAELRDRAKIVTMETVIFLKELLSGMDKIAFEYVRKGCQLLAPWPSIRNSLE